MNKADLRIAGGIILFFSLACCTTKTKEREVATTAGPKYATGFSVTQLDHAKRVEITNPYQGSTSGITYLLVERGYPVPVHDEKVLVVEVPVHNLVCTSTTHIPLLDYLGETNKLIGFPTLDYISSEKMRARIDAGKVTELGADKGMDIERLFALKPDLVMSYLMSADFGQLKKIQEMKVPVVINAEYLEKHPLGRAEWIKFMALFFNKAQVADSVFRGIESEYLRTAALVQNATQAPAVLSGIVYGDTWYMPGGQNYAARLLRDAGCRYLWAEDPSQGFLELSFESVYQKAKDADLWIGVGSFNSLAEIRAAESRYTRFKPFQTGQVYTYNARKGAKGGSEFLESGYLRPDLILKDLVKIAHPGLLPDHTLFFHKRLE